jgi:VIT1/CCC1 family predicted Fe2+/Mn2+ transporter
MVKRVSKQEIESEEIFGGFDGFTSAVGVVIAALLQNNLHTLIVVVAGLATASSLSMGFGEWLADNGRSGYKAFIMAVATLIGTCLPALPFLFLSRVPAILVGSLLCLLTVLLIGKARGKGLRPYIETFIILAVVITATVIISLLAGNLAN